MEIPIDETHRFLFWKAHPDDCNEWSRYLSTKGIEHVIMKHRKYDRFTIYKHMAAGRLHSQPCCASLNKVLSHHKVSERHTTA